MFIKKPYTYILSIIIILGLICFLLLPNFTGLKKIDTSKNQMDSLLLNSNNNSNKELRDEADLVILECINNGFKTCDSEVYSKYLFISRSYVQNLTETEEFRGLLNRPEFKEYIKNSLDSDKPLDHDLAEKLKIASRLGILSDEKSDYWIQKIISYPHEDLDMMLLIKNLLSYFALHDPSLFGKMDSLFPCSEFKGTSNDACILYKEISIYLHCPIRDKINLENINSNIGFCSDKIYNFLNPDKICSENFSEMDACMLRDHLINHQNCNHQIDFDINTLSGGISCKKQISEILEQRALVHKNNPEIYQLTAD